MIKKCVICGAEFSAPPSSKQETCSRSCGSILRNKNMGLYIHVAPGYKIGMLTVIKETKKDMFLCLCECGNTKVICKHALTRTDRPTKSCGCVRNQKGRQPEQRALRSTDKRSKTGVVGVSVCGEKYAATIGYKKKQYNLGVYQTIEEATETRKEAERHKNVDFEQWFKTIKRRT